MKAPTRALIVEDHDSWVYLMHRAARLAGASEVSACKDLPAVREILRSARFDIAILDIGLDPDDDLNSDGIKALEAIREIDGGGTRCVLVTGWQGGDRMDMQAYAQGTFGVDWGFMKEKYEEDKVIAKLTELLQDAPARRLSQQTSMANLSANVQPFYFEAELLHSLGPAGGVQTLYALASRLLTSAIPALAMDPDKPMQQGPRGVWTGVYWSRALASAIAVGLAPAASWADAEEGVLSNLARLLPASLVPDLIEDVRERNVEGRLWELPDLLRDEFPG